MPLWELGLRAALEVGVLLALWQLARAIVKSVSARGQQVRLCLTQDETEQAACSRAAKICTKQLWRLACCSSYGSLRAFVKSVSARGQQVSVSGKLSYEVQQFVKCSSLCADHPVRICQHFTLQV